MRKVGVEREQDCNREQALILRALRSSAFALDCMPFFAILRTFPQRSVALSMALKIHQDSTRLSERDAYKR